MTETQHHTTNPIRKRRRQLGLTLRGLAAACGTAVSTVYCAEVGRRTLPIKLLHGICEATGEPYEVLLEDWLHWRTNGAHGHTDRLEALTRMAAAQARQCV